MPKKTSISYCVCGSKNISVLLDGGTRVCEKGHENSICTKCNKNPAYGEDDDTNTLCDECKINIVIT